MIRFRFDLHPVAGIRAWGGDDPSLHRFALTEGGTGSRRAVTSCCDRALLAAMDEHITALEAAGPPPGVDLDLRHLRRDQRERAGRLRQARARECDTDRDVIRAGARELLASGAGPAPGSS
ncbi:DUF5984 family protein [Streptomyces sp. NPDC006208]|uniref:DUF5984 family protein n=1 Tax=Streptomyces sp. NPDC006208 TaxID=3156734 RepID=UPI0033B77884